MIPTEKKCPRCKVIKPSDAFYKVNRGGTLHLNSRCIECGKELYIINKGKIRIARRKWEQRPEVKDKATKKAIEFRQKKIDWFLSWLGTDKLKCERCRYSGSMAAMQIHHTDPQQKENVHDSFSKWVRKLSFAAFQSKLINTKWIVLCANCHAELHAGLWKYGE